MRKSGLFLGLLVMLLGFSPAAFGDGVKWVLSNVTYGDGGTASGSFVYDAATNTLSDVNIVTTAGTLFGGATYIAVDPGFGPFAFDFAVVSKTSGNLTGAAGLELEFYLNQNYMNDSRVPPVNLTNAGGTIPVDLNEWVCGNAKCSDGDNVRGSNAGGWVIGTPIPEPGTGLLLAAGLAGLALLAARKAA